MTEASGFDLEPEPPPVEKAATPEAPPPSQPSRAERHPLQSSTSSSPEAERVRTKQERRLRARLYRFVPGFTLTFLFVAWMFVGGRYWAYLLAGAALGVFAAYRKTSENTLGAISTAVGFGTTLLVVGFVPSMMTVFLVVSFGMIGWIAGLDDRLRGY